MLRLPLGSLGAREDSSEEIIDWEAVRRAERGECHALEGSKGTGGARARAKEDNSGVLGGNLGAGEENGGVRDTKERGTEGGEEKGTEGERGSARVCL